MYEGGIPRSCYTLESSMTCTELFALITYFSGLTMAEPALELPKTLRNMLGSLMCNNILSSWNISSNGHNAINVNIRFSQPDPVVRDASVV